MVAQQHSAINRDLIRIFFLYICGTMSAQAVPLRKNTQATDIPATALQQL
jgi:hypothetical protein